MNLFGEGRPAHQDEPEAAGSKPFLAAFRQMSGRLRSMASAMLMSDEAAADVLQDAFVRLWPRQADIRSEAVGAALLSTTVRHLAIDELRRRKMHPESPLPDNDVLADIGGCDEGPPEWQARFGEVEALIEERLTSLQRDIMRRKEYEGQGYQEIAAALNMQEAAVRMQLSRARKTIRETYRKQHEHQ